MSEAADMYREHILDLYKDPPHFGELASATHEHREHNPLCGDDITIQLIIEEGKVKDAHFKGKGCAISIASAALVTDKVIGMPIEDVKKLSKDEVLDMLGIPIGPVRLKCALLSLEVVQKAVEK